MFLLNVQVEVCQNILKLRCWSLAFTSYKNFFLRKKRGQELVSVSPRHILHDFRRNILLTLNFIKWPTFIAWLPLLLEILGNMCIVIISCSVCDVINFKINQSLLIKPFSYITKMLGQKCKYLKNKKSSKHETKSIFHHY